MISILIKMVKIISQNLIRIFNEMKKLKNWDNKTWLSSKSYISQFNKFLKTKS